MHAEYLCPALTAFTKDGSFDAAAQHALYDRLIKAGIDGITALGSSGEFYALSLEECREIGLDAIRYVTGRTRVYVGTARPSIEETIALSNEMIGAGATGVIVVGPYYIGCSPEGVRAYYDAVASEVGGNILIYNYPERTGYDIAPLLRALALAHPNIVGVKDTVESPAHTQGLIHAVKDVRPDFKVYNGFDSNLVPCVLAGGDGVIAALSNMAPTTCVSLARAINEGNFGEIAHLHAKICSLMRVYSVVTPFTSGMKHVLACLGLPITDVVRLPALSVTAGQALAAEAIAHELMEDANV